MLNAKARDCFLPSRASVAGQAKRALLEAVKVQGKGQSPLGTAPDKAAIRLFLHPRDARLLPFKALPLAGRERMNAIRSQLEGSLLEDIDQLVISCRFDSRSWFVGFCQKPWLNALVQEAKALGMKLEGIWPAQCLAGSDRPANVDLWPVIEEINNSDLPWPPRQGFHGQIPETLKAFNLLEALVLRGEQASWATTVDGSSVIWQRFVLGLAQVRWAMVHAPKGALSKPLALGLALVMAAAVALQIDTWLLKMRLEASEAALARLFQETMPNQSVMVDPVLQLQRALEKRRQSPTAGSDASSAADPLAGMLLMQRALSRAAGASAAEAIQMVEWTAGPSGGLLSLRWKPSAIEQQSLRPLVQDLAARGGWSVQWGAPQEGLMQWRAVPRTASAS
ncbi:MAG: hypothetical protein KGO85_09140 [Proteobacteria bacterium]|nr:hypothetical protein [Pseudomonadota bacterium]